MESTRKVISSGMLLLLLFVLLASNYEVVEGRVCESRSERFFGKCTTDSGCTSTCRTEGFAGGRCTGLRRRCFCSKIC
ncbi:defensin Ec-AMP-D1-like [Cannabis sativa]|uniref:Knottins-like domain-containing protein n=1 Tax=Cannabis sativa TaxID=3483 RepID=A0A803R7D5_CANSA|nr:defensin Ec-AMP-D1-like [Cannabis sativa]